MIKKSLKLRLDDIADNVLNDIFDNISTCIIECMSGKSLFFHSGGYSDKLNLAFSYVCNLSNEKKSIQEELDRIKSGLRENPEVYLLKKQIGILSSEISFLRNHNELLLEDKKKNK